jgi:ABC-type polysaccharide/polyol phosphate transport system ATPase subunit
LLGIAKGEVFSLLGAIRAGKIILMQMILGLTAPSSRSIDIDRELAFYPHFDDHLTPELTAIENLCFSGALFVLSDPRMIL